MLDLAIKNGSIVDGTGAPPFRADVGISGERIAEIGERVSPADVTIDVTHKVVSPGFIDVHSHSDLTLLVDPGAQSKLQQGVTTEVVGNCGFGVAPVSKDRFQEFVRFWTSSGSEWFNMQPTWENFAE